MFKVFRVLPEEWNFVLPGNFEKIILFKGLIEWKGKTPGKLQSRSKVLLSLANKIEHVWWEVLILWHKKMKRKKQKLILLAVQTDTQYMLLSLTLITVGIGVDICIENWRKNGSNKLITYLNSLTLSLSEKLFELQLFWLVYSRRKARC